MGLRTEMHIRQSRYRALVFVFALIIFLSTLLIRPVACFATPASLPCSRVVSLAPSITEVLFDLNLGSHVVGTTRYCRYPKAAQEVPHVGGLLDINIEEVIRRSPDIVFALSETVLPDELLQRVGVRVIRLDHRSVSNIEQSYRIIGRACAVWSLAESRLKEIESRKRLMAERCVDNRALRFMFVVGHIPGGDGIYISGGDGFYSDVARLLGGVNVHTARTMAVPSVSSEGILVLNPDVIVEIVDPLDKVSDGEFDRFWRRYESLNAVQQGRIVVLREDYASVPGPRYVELVQRLSSVLCER
jgi:iron complex transport system substrate-binding protein